MMESPLQADTAIGRFIQPLTPVESLAYAVATWPVRFDASLLRDRLPSGWRQIRSDTLPGHTIAAAAPVATTEQFVPNMAIQAYGYLGTPPHDIFAAPTEELRRLNAANINTTGTQTEIPQISCAGIYFDGQQQLQVVYDYYLVHDHRQPGGWLIEHIITTTSRQLAAYDSDIHLLRTQLTALIKNQLVPV